MGNPVSNEVSKTNGRHKSVSAYDCLNSVRLVQSHTDCFCLALKMKLSRFQSLKHKHIH